MMNHPPDNWSSDSWSTNDPSADSWSLPVGRPGGVELRIHLLWPLTALTVLLAVKLSLVHETVALWGMFIYVLSVTLHELARALTATRVGGHPAALVLGPIGGLTKVHLPVEPSSHLATALAGPMTYLTLLVTSGCSLAFIDNQSALQLILNPFAPVISTPVVGSVMTTLQLIAQLGVWINWCLLLLSLLPVDPCDGAELLRGLLWPMVGRATAATTTSRIGLATALIVALLAVLIPEDFSAGQLPTWFPLSVLAVFLLFGEYRQTNLRHYDVGLEIDEFDSDDEEWLLSDWDDEEREVVLVEHLQDKQQEVIDRKRREREANEDARVDAILIRLRDMSFEQLSEEDRATLKRASRRYRERLTESEEDL